jgi:hypothetical protein
MIRVLVEWVETMLVNQELEKLAKCGTSTSPKTGAHAGPVWRSPVVMIAK